MSEARANQRYTNIDLIQLCKVNSTCLEPIIEFSFCMMMKKTGVKISDVNYSGVSGTSNSTIAINLNCSQAVPCTNIVLDTIELASSTRGKQVNSSCNNAYGRAVGAVQPKSCLLQQS